LEGGGNRFGSQGDVSVAAWTALPDQDALHPPPLARSDFIWLPRFLLVKVGGGVPPATSSLGKPLVACRRQPPTFRVGGNRSGSPGDVPVGQRRIKNAETSPNRFP
jgi:hypothetical protein